MPVPWQAAVLVCSTAQHGSDELCCSFTSQAPWMLMEGLSWEYPDLVTASGLSLWSWNVDVLKWGISGLPSGGAKTNLFFMLMTNPSCLQLWSSPSSPSTIHQTNIICGFQCVCILNTAWIPHLELDPKQTMNRLHHMKIAPCLAGIWFWRQQKSLWGTNFGTVHAPSSSAEIQWCWNCIKVQKVTGCCTQWNSQSHKCPVHAQTAPLRLISLQNVATAMFLFELLPLQTFPMLLNAWWMW